MYDLSNLKPPKGARRNRKRLGRGNASGQGSTSGKGHKGQNARSGSSITPGFEGGQMPLIRRMPKRGFTNPFRKEFAVVKLSDLKCFPAGSVVDLAALIQAGLVKQPAKHGVKVLGNGEIDVALTVKASKFTRSAKEKLTAAGGTAEEI